MKAVSRRPEVKVAERTDWTWAAFVASIFPSSSISGRYWYMALEKPNQPSSAVA